MPGGDRKGPQGAGPRTGRAQGYCAGHDEPGYVTAGAGRGRQRAGGRGRGLRGGGRGRGQGNGWGARRRDAANQLPGEAELPQVLPSEQPTVAVPVAGDDAASVQEPSELDVLRQQLAAVQHQAEKIADRIEQIEENQ